MPNLATLESIQEALRLLRSALQRFEHGRSHTLTLGGIVWAVAGFDLVKRSYDTLGVPSSINDPREYLVQARNALAGKPVEASESNSYTLHKQCANSGRKILLFVEGLTEGNGANANDFTDKDVVRVWLNELEGDVESYRAGYRGLTGIDIAASGENVEQAAAA
jgi:hypothetical protein